MINIVYWCVCIYITLHTVHAPTADLICLSIFQVKALKEKIENEKGKESFPVAGQKLIYAGLSFYVCVCGPKEVVFGTSDVGVFVRERHTETHREYERDRWRHGQWLFIYAKFVPL